MAGLDRWLVGKVEPEYDRDLGAIALLARPPAPATSRRAIQRSSTTAPVAAKPSPGTASPRGCVTDGDQDHQYRGRETHPEAEPLLPRRTDDQGAAD